MTLRAWEMDYIKYFTSVLVLESLLHQDSPSNLPGA